MAANHPIPAIGDRQKPAPECGLAANAPLPASATFIVNPGLGPGSRFFCYIFCMRRPGPGQDSRAQGARNRPGGTPVQAQGKDACFHPVPAVRDLWGYGL